MANNVSRVLERAKNRLVKYGWIKGTYGCRSAGFCSVGAIYASTQDGPLCQAARDVLRVVIGQDSIIAWNDNKRRTKREVLSVFGKAIKQAEAA